MTYAFSFATFAIEDRQFCLPIRDGDATLSYALGFTNSGWLNPSAIRLMTHPEAAIVRACGDIQSHSKQMLESVGLQAGPSIFWCDNREGEGGECRLCSLTALRVPDDVDVLLVAEVMKSTSFPADLVVSELECVYETQLLVKAFGGRS